MPKVKTNPLTSFLESVELRMVRPPKRSLRSDPCPVSGLMSSIQQKGLLEPIVVRPIEKGFEVVAGNRRFEACKKLGWRSIPCHVVELDDKEAFEVSILENVQRETLNPIEEGRAYRNYVDEYGYGGESELARKIGKSQEYVSRRIGLLSLPERVQKQIMRRRIAPSVAQELTLLNDDAAEQMADAISEQRLSLRDVRRMIKYSREGKAESGEFLPSFIEGVKAGDDRRVQRLNRELNKAIASLRTSIVRLGEVAESIEDDWLVEESIFVCRDNLRTQIDNLTRLKRKVERKRL